jgi:hypothetical protein
VADFFRFIRSRGLVCSWCAPRPPSPIHSTSHGHRRSRLFMGNTVIETRRSCPKHWHAWARTDLCRSTINIFAEAGFLFRPCVHSLCTCCDSQRRGARTRVGAQVRLGQPVRRHNLQLPHLPSGPCALWTAPFLLPRALGSSFLFYKVLIPFSSKSDELMYNDQQSL